MTGEVICKYGSFRPLIICESVFHKPGKRMQIFQHKRLTDNFVHVNKCDYLFVCAVTD